MEAVVSRWLLTAAAGMLIAAMPASDNFQLNSYGFGNGGTANSSSGNYRVNGITGEVSGKSGSTHYKVKAGEAYVKQADASTIVLYNDDNWYNKLRVVLDPHENQSRSDTKYAIEISTDNFATVTKYIKSDFTIGDTLQPGDYMSCVAWGAAACGGGGSFMLRGLHRSTVYSARVRTIHGDFTETVGPPASGATTEDPTLVFDIDVSATDQSTDPPYQLDLGDLLPNVIENSADRVWVTLETNGESGGKVYISGQNAGLKSDEVNYTIVALDGDLGTQNEGFGAQAVSATQTAGGPLSKAEPYDGANNVVGPTDSVIREIFTSAAPITGGRGSFIMKAKTRVLTPSSDDYAEVLTAIASASF